MIKPQIFFNDKIKKTKDNLLMTTTLVKPSQLLPEGICIQHINNLILFKFTDKLGERMQELLDKNKLDTLTPEEAIELEAIGELDDIFSYINSAVAAQDHAHS
ncbi:hypothetical protein NIES806_12290 [Dolichospermum compactum NIES-806]|uniref:Uncharacterized protein n=2 Tax=Nostocales TaxID=1161 RepID=A0A1Z4V0X9_9CYAN|nr:hypothetical protein NIES806_12290 [Dolichospermum compactum NIES-806]